MHLRRDTKCILLYILSHTILCAQIHKINIKFLYCTCTILLNNIYIMSQMNKHKLKFLSHVSFFCHFVYSNWKIEKIQVFFISSEFHTFLIFILFWFSCVILRIFLIKMHAKGLFHFYGESTFACLWIQVIHYVFRSCNSQFYSVSQAPLNSLCLLILIP